MSENVGIIALAWGQQAGEYPKAGPSNREINLNARLVSWEESRRGNNPRLGTQWETSDGLSGLRDYRQVSHFRSDTTHHVHTKYVLDESIAYFREHGVKRVILVGHPLHLLFIHLLVKAGIWRFDGITFDRQYDNLTEYVPYDKSPGNVHWWTANPFAFIVYGWDEVLKFVAKKAIHTLAPIASAVMAIFRKKHNA